MHLKVGRHRYKDVIPKDEWVSVNRDRSYSVAVCGIYKAFELDIVVDDGAASAVK